jgi:hypothetical protein
MVLPTYLDIKEAAKRIEQKCHEPVTPKWLLQHASEGRLQLFALVRNVAGFGFGCGEDVCVMTGAKPFGSSRMNTPEKAPMCVASERVFDGDQFPLDYLDQAISVVHAIGSRVPLADEWAGRLIANQTADIYTVTIDGEQASVISRINSNWRLHENGRIVGNAWPWKVRLDELCFRSEDIDRLIDANPSAAAAHPKPPTASTETKPVPAKVGAGDTATDEEDTDLARLFDPVPVTALEKMFPSEGKWAGWAEHASRHPELKAARQGRAMFNPYLAGIWFARKGRSGWDLARCRRTLANNLPDRSLDDKHRLTGELE